MTTNELDTYYKNLGDSLKDGEIAPVLQTLMLSLQSRNVTFGKWNELVSYVGILVSDLKDTYEFIGKLNEYVKGIDTSSDDTTIDDATIDSLINRINGKTAVTVNGEVQTEWDATGVNVKNNNSWDVVAVLKKNNGGIGGYASINANAPQSGTFVVRNTSGAIHGNTSDSDADTVLVNKRYLFNKLTEIVGEEGAIEALDTLRELGAAINNDADFAGTMIAKHNEMEARLNRVDKFTADDVNKLVVVGADGELVAKYIPTGGSYGDE